MGKAIFIAATGTDVGKTYISRLLINELQARGEQVGYFKPVISGLALAGLSDVAYIAKHTLLPVTEMTSFEYQAPYSPHLASVLEKKPLNLEQIQNDYNRLIKKYDYLIVEGCGGVVCPLRLDQEMIMLTDLIRHLNLDVLLVGDSNLGAINAAITAVSYLQSKDIAVKGIILNHWQDSLLNEDNLKTIEQLSLVSVVAKVKNQAACLIMADQAIYSIF